MLKVTRTLFFAALLALPVTLITSLGYVRVYTFDVLFFPLLASLVIMRVMYPNSLRIHIQSADKAMLVVVVAVTLSMLLSDSIGSSVTNWVDWMRYSTIYFASRALFENRVVTVTQLEWLFIFIGTALVVVGITQLVTQSKIGLISANFGGGRFDSAAMVSEHYSSGVYHRVSGTHPNPNIYAMWVTLFFSPLLIRLLLNRKYWWFLFMGVAGALAIVGSLARGGTAAYFLFLLILMVINAKRLFDTKFLIISVLTGVIVLSLGAAGLVTNGLNVEEKLKAFDTRVEQAVTEGQAEGRFLQIVTGFQEMKRPKVLVFGTGWGNYQNDRRNVIHNMWMQILTELGALVFIAVLGLSVSFAKTIRKLSNNYNIEGETKYLRNYLLSTLLPFLLISSQVYHTAGEHELLIPIMVIMGLTVSMSLQQVSRRSSRASEPVGASHRVLAPAKKRELI